MNDIVINEAYGITSLKTGKPFLDEENSCFYFENRQDADEFAAEHPDTVVDAPRYLSTNSIQKECYAYGADYITIVDGKNKKQIGLTQAVMDCEYHNHTLDQLLIKIKQERKMRYLLKLVDERFLVPVCIRNHEDGPEIRYAVAQNAEEDILFIAFSNLSEFTAWGSKVPGWNVIETGYMGLAQIAKHHGVMFNPFGLRFILKRSMMEYINYKEVRSEPNSEVR